MIPSLILMAITAPPAEYREWFSADYRYSCYATLERQTRTAVVLRRLDTKRIVTVPIAKLSRDDQAYLASRPPGTSAPVAEHTARQARIAVRRAAERRAAWERLRRENAAAAAMRARAGMIVPLWW